MRETNLFRSSKQHFELINSFELLSMGSMAPLTQDLVYIILLLIYLGVPGVAQEGGGGGYHFASSAGLPKLDSTLEILFVTACASQSAQKAQSEGDLLLVCR